MAVMSADGKSLQAHGSRPHGRSFCPQSRRATLVTDLERSRADLRPPEDPGAVHILGCNRARAKAGYDSPVKAAGHSTRASVRLSLALLAAAVLAGGCTVGGPSPVDTGPSPTARPSPEVTTTTVPLPDPSPEENASTASPPEPPPPSSEVTATTVPPPEPSRKWKLLAGGDVLMDRTEPRDVDPFEFIEPPLASADIAVVNSEMVISDRGVPVDKIYVFRAPPSAARRIAAAGVDVASLANNHAKDYGSTALVDTVELLEAAGVAALGAGSTDVEAYRYRVLDVEGAASVAFVGVSMIVPRSFPAGPDSPGIASARPPSRVVQSIEDAAWAADVVIALVHWGIERSTCPSAAQRSFAQELLDAGADAVIGHHPHVLQPVEFADGRLVAYSLGNFVWHPRWGITGETGVLQIDFDADRIVGWGFHPHLLNDDGAPVPVAEGGRFDRIVDIISGNCARHQPPPPETSTTSITSDTVTTTETRAEITDTTTATETPATTQAPSGSAGDGG